MCSPGGPPLEGGINIDARSAGPPFFVRQPAIYQPNPKELQHPSQHSSAVNHRWYSRRAGVWSRSESHHPDPLEKGVLCPFTDPRHAARASLLRAPWGESARKDVSERSKWRVYKAWPVAKQPTSSRSGVLDIMRHIIAVAVGKSKELCVGGIQVASVRSLACGQATHLVTVGRSGDNAQHRRGRRCG